MKIVLSLMLCSAPSFAAGPAATDALFSLSAQTQAVVSPDSAFSAARSAFDGSGQAQGRKLAQPEAKKAPDAPLLAELKAALSSGIKQGKPSLAPFVFADKSGVRYTAQSAGLEGFLYTKKEIEGRFGAENFTGQIDDYFKYLDYLLADYKWAAPLVSELRALRDKPLTPVEKSARLTALLDKYLSGFQQQTLSADQASWIRTARIYQMFPRAYNIAGRRGRKDGGNEVFFRDFKASDFAPVKRMGFDAVYVMGIFPIGERNRSGTGGGSPFSIKDHAALNPELGTEADFRKFVANAHDAGLKVIIDFVVNHTAMDSVLLEENPDYYLNRPGGGQCPRDYFDYFRERGKKPFCIAHGGFAPEGSLYTWIDTAQLNYASPAVHAKMASIVKSWVARFDVDGFRVDMAYVVLNPVFSRAWNVSPAPSEFYPLLFSEVRSAKPSVAFIAEAYANQPELSALGFDMIYSKHEMRAEGQTGWYNALESGNSAAQAGAMNRAAFLAWQTGGAGGVNFAGNHDEPAPEKVFGVRLPAVLALTLLAPGPAMVYDGAEIGCDESIPTEQKTLPFNIPVKINWNGGKPEIRELYRKVFAETGALRKELGEYSISPLWPPNGQGWTGYLLESKSHPGLKKAIIANAGVTTTRADISGAVSIAGTLQPGEYQIVNAR